MNKAPFSGHFLRRKDARRRVNCDALIEHRDVSRKIEIVDFSNVGLRIDKLTGLATGDRVTIVLAPHLSLALPQTSILATRKSIQLRMISLVLLASPLGLLLLRYLVLTLFCLLSLYSCLTSFISQGTVDRDPTMTTMYVTHTIVTYFSSNHLVQYFLQQSFIRSFSHC